MPALSLTDDDVRLFITDALNLLTEAGIDGDQEREEMGVLLLRLLEADSVEEGHRALQHARIALRANHPPMPAEFAKACEKVYVGPREPQGGRSRFEALREAIKEDDD